MIEPIIPPWMEVAIKELGVSEVPGPGNNPRIVDYHRSTSSGPSDDEIPWCSSFVNFCFKQAGIKGTNSKAARSWLGWGYKITYPVFGCVVVTSRGTNPAQGHVGFWVGNGKILGGNQGDKVSIASFDRFRVLCYRLP